MKYEMCNNESIEIIFTNEYVLINKDNNYEFKLNLSLINYKQVKDIIRNLDKDKEYNKYLEVYERTNNVKIIEIIEYIYAALLAIDVNNKLRLAKYYHILDLFSNRKLNIGFIYTRSVTEFLISGLRKVALIKYE